MACFAFAVLVSSTSFGSEESILHVPGVGILKGEIDGPDGAKMRAFRGIPYAIPPIGKLRWQPPQPHPGLPGTFDATNFGPSCLQQHSWKSANVSWMSEDCLTLNVFAPIPTNISNLSVPVMVYIHAGEFTVGTSNDEENNWPYGLVSSDGTRMIVVTANSRLGILGYGAHPSLRAHAGDNSTGNYGLQDQRAALRWVRQHVTAFGGDPERVTIFGESSGGTAVSVHLAAKRSWGLFSKAILESPGVSQVNLMSQSLANTKMVVSELAFKSAAKGTNSNPNCKLSSSLFDMYPDVGISSKVEPLHLPGMDNVTTVASARALCAQTASCMSFTVTTTKVIDTRNENTRNENTRNDDPNSDTITTKIFRFYSVVGPFRRLVRGTVNTPPRGGSGVVAYVRAAVDDTADRSPSVLSCLLSTNATDLLAIDGYAPYRSTALLDTWAPTVDGVELTDTVFGSLKKEQIAPGVSVLAGSNMDEETTFMSLTPGLKIDASESEFRQWSLEFYGPDLGSAVVDIYNRHPPLRPFPLMHPRSDTHKYANATSSWSAAMRSSGDFSFFCPARMVAKTVADGGFGSAFFYWFTLTPSFSVNFADAYRYGSFHGAEIPFVFGDTFELNTTVERDLARTMGCWWATFAQTGDPNTPDDSGRRCSNVTWPRYTVSKSDSNRNRQSNRYSNGQSNGSDTLLRLDTGSLLGPMTGFNAELCDLFEKYFI